MNSFAVNMASLLSDKETPLLHLFGILGVLQVLSQPQKSVMRNNIMHASFGIFVFVQIGTTFVQQFMLRS